MTDSLETHWTPQTAALMWRLGQSRQEDENCEAFEEAETFLLGRSPTSFDEAGVILKVLIEQAGDGKTDGLDVQALRNLLSFVSTISTGRAEQPDAGFAARVA